MKLNDYEILLVNNGLMLSPFMTKKEAHEYIAKHPHFRYKYGALCFTIFFLLAISGSAQTKTFTPQMCQVKQPAPVDIGYIHYCMDVSERKFPACPVTAPPKALTGKTIYFEVLDCSWHEGKNPRVRIRVK